MDFIIFVWESFEKYDNIQISLNRAQIYQKQDIFHARSIIFRKFYIQTVYFCNKKLFIRDYQLVWAKRWCHAKLD